VQQGQKLVVNAGEARRLTCHELASRSTNAWVPVCFDGGLSASGSIAGGHPFFGEGNPVNNGLDSIVASVEAATSHVATGDSLTSWMPRRT
jgi:hypothetical protein